jgi:hypothetical protein
MGVAEVVRDENKLTGEGVGNGQRSTSTRDAVETTIDMAKEDKSGTWEGHLLNASPNRISRWRSGTS